MLKKTFLLISTFIISQLLFANDSYFSLIGGNFVPVDKEIVPIEIRDEVITIDLQDDFYEVTVDFTFYNHGDTVNLIIGFPFFVPGSTAKHGKIYDFKYWINGIETLFEFEDLSNRWSYDSYKSNKLEKVYTNTVNFEKEKNTKAKMTYKSTYAPLGGYWRGYYLYGTGSSWKNLIGKITLRIINNHSYGFLKSVYMGDMFYEKFPKKELKENFEKKTDNIFEAVLYNVNPNYKDVFCITFEDILNDVGPKRFPAHFLYNKKIADPDDLLWYRKDQLRIVRNAIYAIHGYSFKSKDLQDFFNYRGTEWRPTYQERKSKGFSESEMTDIEKKNIEIILAEEKRR